VDAGWGPQRYEGRQKEESYRKEGVILNIEQGMMNDKGKRKF
jgi:hypothetical protein